MIIPVLGAIVIGAIVTVVLMTAVALIAILTPIIALVGTFVMATLVAWFLIKVGWEIYKLEKKSPPDEPEG